MRLFTSTVVAVLLGSVASFTIPENLPDGMYIVEAGSDIPVRQPDVLVPALSARDLSNHPRNLFKRLDDPRISCRGYKYSGNDYGQAFANMNNWCNNQGGRSTGFTTTVVVVGSAVAYICNYTDGTNTCFHEFDQADALMNVNCGIDAAADVNVPTHFKTLGRANTGVRICF